MGVSRKQAETNRGAIVNASERLFRERGVDGVGLAALMKEAGFTQGGFYNHFPSKDALAVETVAHAVDRSLNRIKEMVEAPLPSGQSPLGARVDYYLSEAHCGDIAQGCPFAGLAADVRRLGSQAQAPYAAGLETTFAVLTELFKTQFPELEPEEARAHAIAFYTQMAGAVLLARAVEQFDPALTEEILSSTRRVLLSGTLPVAVDASEPNGR